MTRSTERTEFLRDIFTTALEGGINYWASVETYEHTGEDPHALILDTEENFSHMVTLGTIAHGISLISKAKAGEIPFLPEWQRKLVAHCSRVNDIAPDDYQSDEADRPGFGNFGSDIDSDVADNILQVGLWGRVVYG